MDAARRRTSHGAGSESRDRAFEHESGVRDGCRRAIPHEAAARGQNEELGLYKSTDAGEHWSLAAGDKKPDPRPLLRIGGGDLATLAVDPKNENVIYSASIVFWRSENGGVTWSAVRGSPGGDDYQKVWVNPNDPNILLVVVRSGRSRFVQPRRVVEQLVHAAHGGDVSRVDGQLVSRIACAAGSRTPVPRASTAARWTGRSPSTIGIR